MITTILLALATLAGHATPTPAPAEVLGADLDGDGDPELVRFYLGPDGSRGFLVRGEVVSRIYRTWKALPGRLPGARGDVIVLGIWTTKRIREGEPPNKTLWVVGFEHGRWVERWRGSALARPFEDFALIDLDDDGYEELVVRECEGVARPGLSAYRWSGFGFDGAGRMPWPCGDDSIAWSELRLAKGRLWLGR